MQCYSANAGQMRPSVSGRWHVTYAPICRPVQQARKSRGRVQINAYLEEGNMWHNANVKHVVESQQFGKDALDVIFAEARKMERVRPGTAESKLLEGRIMATLFYEPSTRTRLSFESAMSHLGGMILSTESAGEYSSAAKGETLEDTIRTIEGYADCIVLRHFQEGASKRAASVSSIPILNAGDGPGQHPSQVGLKQPGMPQDKDCLARLEVSSNNTLQSQYVRSHFM